MSDNAPTERQLDWFRVPRSEQFLIGVPMDIVGVGSGYFQALANAKAALAKPHTTIHRDLLAAECNELAALFIQLAKEDGNADSLGSAFQAMMLEAAGDGGGDGVSS